MAQKDKIKELVGRSLNSYHTKALQQIDRIEKKNKEQNHKISILSNELDNDYLTKTEEGSVISLEHSKEGMVYLDELQGNTLVNYCTDGSKEMTLNGDIDVEGTFITTTEGVDNGKVDVLCEGNTLVNLVNRYSYHANQYSHVCFFRSGMLKPNTRYSAIITNPSNEVMRLYWNEGIFDYVEIDVPADSTKVFTHTTKTEMNIDVDSTLFKNAKTHTQAIQFKVIFLEGDWTNKELPTSYFKGMKSVGQDDTNGHKIEILSQNYQELNTDTNGLVCHLKAGTSAIINNIMSDLSGNGNNATLYGASINGNYLNFNGESDYATINRCVSDDFTISLKAEVISAKGGSLGNDSLWYNYAGLVDGEYASVVNDFGLTITNEGYPCLGIGKPDTTVRHKETCFNKLTTFTYTRNKTTGEMKLYIDGKHSATISSTNKNSLNDSPLLFIGRGSTKVTAYAKMKFYELKIYNKVLNESEIFKFNKKEILLNEPLRGLPNGVRDKKVKIGNKWFIERNCGEFTVTEDVLTTKFWGDDGNKRYIYVSILPNMKNDSYIYTDKIPTANNFHNSNYFGVSSTTVLIFCFPTEIQTIEEKKELVKPYLQNGGLKVTYQLNTPTYEPLETEPILNTYNDITHISNNSIIPCNMKIQNTGYNAIIKPSTLYTVALDTNKSGTIGINLAGAKVTTTNNVATVTTPATLSDDSLRLYGKGIKGSKVRLLEGDKTNWIPSFFEGMKSSFEDKVQEDGSYKMEILSNSQNLLIKEEFIRNKYQNFNPNNNAWSISTNTEHTVSNFIRIKPNKKYYKNTAGGAFYDKHKNVITNTVCNTSPFTTPTNAHYLVVNMNTNNLDNGYNYYVSEVQEEVDYGMYNKIQFSSIEPLRKWDRFVFKDNKLMIERGSGIYTFNGSEDWHYDTNTTNTTNNGRCNTFLPNLIISEDYKVYVNEGYIIADRFALSGFPIGNGGKYKSPNTICGYKTSNIYIFPDVTINSKTEWLNWLSNNPLTVVYKLATPTYEEVPFELQKIILEGYENGTLFIDTNIPPTSTVRYAGETPIAKATKLNKTEVLNNTNDINDNIIPYLMDMDYRVVCLQLQSENINDGVSMARLFGGAYEMLQRDIQSRRYSVDEYKHRLDAYLDANKITEEEYNKLGDMLNE